MLIGSGLSDLLLFAALFSGLSLLVSLATLAYLVGQRGGNRVSTRELKRAAGHNTGKWYQ